MRERERERERENVSEKVLERREYRKKRTRVLTYAYVRAKTNVRPSLQLVT